MIGVLTGMMMSSLFVSQGQCYSWQTELIGLHLVADLTIAIAYFSIPILLFYFAQQRPDLPFNSIFKLFGTFIICCGAINVLEVVTLWYPVYWFAGAVKLGTAIVSAFTAIVLWRLLPQALNLVSPAQLTAINLELQQEIRDRELAEAQIQKLNEELEAKVAHRTQELAASEERLNLSLDAAHIGTYDWNLGTGKITCNQYHAELTGYDTIAEIDSFGSWDRRLAPEERDRVTALLFDARDTHTDYRAEYRIVWDDGSSHWLEAFGRFFYNPDGVAVRMAGVINDISDRKQAELAQSESQERISLALNAAQMGLYDWELDTDRLVWNNHHARLLGYGDNAGEYRYPDWERRIHPEDLPRVLSAIEIARAEHTDFASEYRVVWDDGSIYWIAAFGRFLYDLTDRPLRSIGVVFDITARRTANLELQRFEQSLRQSERRYRALVGATAKMTWITTAAGAIEAEIPGWEAFTGQSFAEHRDYGWLDAVHPDDRDYTLQFWREAVANLSMYEIEHRLRRFDGEYRYMSARGVPILNADASVQEWVGIHTDITDERIASLQLRRSEEFKQRMLENNHDCIKILDLDGRMLYMNDGGRKLLEIEDFGQFERASWAEFWHDTDLEAAERALAQARQGEVAKFEGRCSTLSGKPKWWEVTVTPLLDDRGEVEQLMVISHDITVRKLSESEMRENEERFRATFEQAAVGFAHVALDGKWLRVNQRLCEIVGYSAAELLDLTFQDITHPDDLNLDLEYVRRLIAGEIKNYTMEKRYIQRQGTPIWINLTVSLRLDAAGAPMHMISAIEDISLRKHSEAELHTQTIKLAKTTALAERRNQELERFSYIVSHDLKAPLRGISNLSQWIEDDLVDIDPDTKTNLELLRDRVRRMEAMINGLLEYARLGNVESNIETFAVEDLLAEVVDSLNLPATFSIELPSQLPKITTNRILLERVFANLIGNAYNHHDRPEGKIHITAVPQAAIWEFTVTDDGPGIPPANRDRVFDIFQTLSNKSDKNNTGIGLSIVKRSIENCGGEIKIVDPPASPTGRGTSFRFTWVPVSEQ